MVLIFLTVVSMKLKLAASAVLPQQQQYYTPGQKLRSNGYLIYKLITQSLTLWIF